MVSRSSNKFSTAVSTIRSALRRRINSKQTVSSVDITNVAPSITGSERGAAVREAFASLVREGFIKPTNKSVYNMATRHRVTVYIAA